MKNLFLVLLSIHFCWSMRPSRVIPPKPGSGIIVINHSNSGLLFQSNGRGKKNDEFYQPAEYETQKYQNEDEEFERFSPNNVNSYLADPPPHEQTAQMARFIVKNSNWTSLATISSREPIVGFPFSNIISVSDGPLGGSTGVPFFYLTPLDMSVIDMKKNSKVSLSMSLAQGNYCRLRNYDPEDPRCARVILSGNLMKVAKDEEDFAKMAVFSKHPEMKGWPKDHGWFFGKLEISNILLLDYFGGALTVPTDKYFNAN